MFFVIISISIYNFGIYLILVLSNCNAIQSTDCHVRHFNKLSILLYYTNPIRIRQPSLARAWPQQCWKSCVNGSNIVALRFGDTEQKKCWELLAQTFDQFQTLRNNSH